LCGDPPPLIVGRENVTVIPGQDAQLTCVVQSSVEFNVTWRRVVSGDVSDHHLDTFSNGTAVIRSLSWFIWTFFFIFKCLLLRDKVPNSFLPQCLSAWRNSDVKPTMLGQT